MGRDRYLWGRWLGSTLSSLGADIANLSVTRIPGDDNHVQYAASGTGFLAVSAWCPICSQDLGRYADLEHVWAVGVAIAVLKDILGHCFDAQRDSVGWGIAGNGTLSSGVVLRVSHRYFTGV